MKQNQAKQIIKNMNIAHLLNTLPVFESKYIKFALFREDDLILLQRLSDEYKDEFISKIILDDKEFITNQKDELLLGKNSILIRQFRIGEVYTKDNNSMDVRLIVNNFCFKYHEIESVTIFNEMQKSKLCFNLKNSNSIESINIPDTSNLSIIFEYINKILLYAVN